MFLPFLKRQILDSSMLKEFVDDNFKFDENGRKLSKSGKNTAEKGNVLTNRNVLTLSQTTNFRLFHAKGVCRRQF